MHGGCEHAIEYVYHYLDEELTWSRRMRIRWHLRRCTNCDGAFSFEQQLKAVVRRKSQDEAPPELIDRLRALIQEEGPGSPRSD